MENLVNMTNTSILEALRSTTCQDLREFLKNLPVSHFEAYNRTREAFIRAWLTPHYIPKPYLGAQGLIKWLVVII